MGPANPAPKSARRSPSALEDERDTMIVRCGDGKMPLGAMEGNAGPVEQASDAFDGGTDLEGGEPGTLVEGEPGVDAQDVAKAGRRHDLDRAARRGDGDVPLAGAHDLAAREGSEEGDVPRGPVGEKGDALDAVGAILVALERGSPEVLRLMMLAGEEPGLRYFGRDGESHGERHPGVAAVRPLAPPLEEERGEAADAGCVESEAVRLRVARLEDEHGEALAMAGDEVAHEEREAERARRRRRRCSLAGRDQLEEHAGKLDEPVPGAPGMIVAGSDLKAHAPVVLARDVEVRDGEDEVVEAARHAPKGRAGHTRRLCSTAASMKLRNSGWGSKGRD